MSSEIRQVTVFVSSPAELASTRAAVKEAVQRINDLASFRDRLIVRAFLYEESAPAIAGRSPQETIDSYVIRPEASDILVCALGTRIGTPFTDRPGHTYMSGAVYEFEKAYEQNEADGRPHILLYRCRTPVDPFDWGQHQ